VIGAGMGGLAAAIDLAVAGHGVTVVERAAVPGGKMRGMDVAGHTIDAGPTVLTLRLILDELLADAGATESDLPTLRPAALLARHAWGEAMLDLYPDMARNTDAIGDFAGAEAARAYRVFAADSQRLWAAMEHAFLRRSQPGLTGMLRATGASGLASLLRLRPGATLWTELGRRFRDQRLRQLFARYATYVGASPFEAPATLMLIAHAERLGVWLVDGGMRALAASLARLAAARGVRFRYGCEVASLDVAQGRVRGVVLAGGERIAAGAVVLNGDPLALAAGLVTIPAMPRSLSAMTWCMLAEPRGFPLARHNVFFGADYRAEFADLAAARTPADPTVYVCAETRDGGAEGGAGTEKLFCLVNAPADGDRKQPTLEEIARCRETMASTLRRSGLELITQTERVTTPADFDRAFPGRGGALYGPAMRGWMAAFRRPGNRTRIAGLYLAGGAVHPGPGVPMALLSGRHAAASLIADRASRVSTARSPTAATPGGISTRPARTHATPSS
jgi:1-hydroxycarotenoid 3,4-desaturase